MREATGIIEDDLLSTVAEALTSLQHVDSCNRGFTSLRGQFCPLLTKEIKSQGYCRMVLLQSGFLEQGGGGEGSGQLPLVLYLYLLAG